MYTKLNNQKKPEDSKLGQLTCPYGTVSVKSPKSATKYGKERLSYCVSRRIQCVNDIYGPSETIEMMLIVKRKTRVGVTMKTQDRDRAREVNR